MTNAKGLYKTYERSNTPWSSRCDYLEGVMLQRSREEKGQNVWVRLPGTTLRVPEEVHNPWPNKLPRQLEVVHGGSGSVSRTSFTNGQKVALHRGDTADSTVSECNLQKLHGTSPHRGLGS
uniref:Uncharacterized protein n=1 Tax=Solanum tuberosum TaxID=4113 RepID=M1DYK8_SOLTU